MTITLFLTVMDSSSMGVGTLYEKRLPSDHVPAAGDRVEVLPDVHLDVRDRYWNGDGSVGVQMIRILPDPSEQMKPHADGVFATIWRTEDDGDPHEQLKAFGWKEYGQ